MPTTSDAQWTIVLPVKALSSAKTRMAPGRGGAGGRLALAFFRDTATAATACRVVRRVVVSTSDPVVAAVAAALGCTVVDDRNHPGINAAARHAAAACAPTGPVAVAVSDLPCLTPEALEAALGAAAAVGRVCFVADADGTGTTMWLDPAGGLPDSRFGPRSADEHRAAGAVDLAATAGIELAPVRRDVDTEADLADALVSGVGAATLEALRPEAVVPDVPPTDVVLTALGRTPDGDLEAADEAGARRTVAWSAVTAAGFREIRPGQRLVVDGRGAVHLP